MSQASQLGQQGSDHGQYGQTPITTPYGMNTAGDANAQQNNNTQNVGDYSPMLPSGGLTQGQTKQWYPGMYPSTSPQFGTNPYSPQTFNVQGHPGHNPSTIAAVEPNMTNSALSNQGQFDQVKTMAIGGTSTPYSAGNFKYTGPAKSWNGPVNVNQTPQQASDHSMNAMLGGKGLGQSAQQPTNAGMKAPGMLSVMSAENPEFAKAMGKGPAQPIQVAEPSPVPQVNPASQIYKPVYDQYANIGLPRPRG